jgi:peptidoglycan hydrolase-like protein with peptidoglycan-binding domain
VFSERSTGARTVSNALLTATVLVLAMFADASPAGAKAAGADGRRATANTTRLTVEAPGQAVLLRRGDRGELVAEWQSSLNRWLSVAEPAADPLVVDGEYGDMTDDVTRLFQFVNGVPVDGVVGSETRAAYASALTPMTVGDAPDEPLLAVGARGPAVAFWQRQLNRWSRAASLGWQVGVDGVFGPETEAATLAFQRAQSVRVDGLVGSETRAALLQVPSLVGRQSAVPPTAAPSANTEPALAAAESATPASGICPEPDGTVVSFALGPEIATPRCAAVSPAQRLQLHNSGGATEVAIGDVTVALESGETAVVDRPFGTYLAIGVHTLHVRRFGGSGPQVWLQA